MTRLLVLTVGKTHSGKTTFARELEQQLAGALVIDQDNHAEFINQYYRVLLPTQGPNTIKYAVTETIVDYAVRNTSLHLILCNANRVRRERLAVLERFRQNGFITIIVSFDVPDDVLQARIAKSDRSTTIFRTASGFSEVLRRQQNDSGNGEVFAPSDDEADYLFSIRDNDDSHSVIRNILDIAQSA